MIPKELFKKIRQIEIRTKGLVNEVFGGEYHSAFKGQGIEFSEVRPYQYGDDIRSIDWNVSARVGEPFIKLFEEEREQTVILAVDVSGSGDFGTQSKFKREIAAEICAILAFSAIRNGDKVGVLLFSDQIELFVPPKKGKRHVLRIIRDIFAHENQSRGTDLSKAINHLLHVLRRRSIILLLSDFMDDGYEKPLKALGRKHDTIAVHIVDPIEESLPPVGMIELTDNETGETIVVDSSSKKVRESLTDFAYEKKEETREILKRASVDRIPVNTNESYIDPLIHFFKKRTRVR